jgi:hypothetical protein
MTSTAAKSHKNVIGGTITGLNRSWNSILLVKRCVVGPKEDPTLATLHETGTTVSEIRIDDHVRVMKTMT